MFRRLILSCAVALLALPAAAQAAPGDAVLADWRADGIIECDHKLSELRAADAQINPQEREYTFWDADYAAAVRCVQTGKAPERAPTVPPQDFDRDGDVDAKDKATAAKKTKALREKLERCESGNVADLPKDCPKVDDERDVHSAEEPDEDLAAATSADDDAGGGDGWLFALLFAIPAAVIGIGAWRMQRSRAKGEGRAKPDGEPPVSSFASSDDA